MKKKDFIMLTKAINGQRVMLASDKIDLCEWCEDGKTRITYRLFGNSLSSRLDLTDFRIIDVEETVETIHSLIYEGL